MRSARCFLFHNFNLTDSVQVVPQGHFVFLTPNVVRKTGHIIILILQTIDNLLKCYSFQLARWFFVCFHVSCFVQNVEVELMVGDRNDGHVPTSASDRKVLWGGEGCFAELVPARYGQYVVRTGVLVGNPYVRIYNPDVIAVHNVSAFLHGPSPSHLKRMLRNRKPIVCSIEVACSTLSNGRKNISIDYRCVKSPPPEPTVKMRIVPVNDLKKLELDEVTYDIIKLDYVDALLAVTKIPAKQKAA